MAGHVDETAERIVAAGHRRSAGRMISSGYLMKEYLRRAAWWAKITGASGFPFFDIAAAVEPAVRADPQVIERVVAHLTAGLHGMTVTRACVNALHFAALLDARVPLPQAPGKPFEPLLLIVERGSSFRVEGSGLIDVGMLGVRAGTVAENLQAEPCVQLDQLTLDMLDSPPS